MSIDALRADHLSCYGYDRPTTPEIDRLAARGTRYSKAFANTHGTPPSHTTMLSSLYQETHRVGIAAASGAGPEHAVPPGVVMVQETLAAAGWRTVAVTGGGYMSAEFGFARGFQVFDDGARSVDEGTRRLRELLSSPDNDGRPVFALLHTYQVHSPYTPPPGFDRLFGEYSSRVSPTSEALLKIQGRAGQVLEPADFEFLEALYDGDIRFTDQVLGELLRSLDDLGLTDNTVVIITSDHGEEFGEHGGLLHGGTLYEELLHVPLVIAGPGFDGGAVDPSLVSLVDIAPTVLALAKLDVPEAMEGRSLLDGPLRSAWPGQRVFSQYGDSLYCVRTPRWKLIRRPANGVARLFDLRGDPAERRDVSAAHPELTERLVEELARWRAGRPRLAEGEPAETNVSVEKVEELKALGYVE